MIESLMSAAVIVALCVNPMPPSTIQVESNPLMTPALDLSAESLRPPARTTDLQQTSHVRDSLKNGAIIGAIAGAAAGALLAAVGCALAHATNGGSDSSCVGGTVILVGTGAGIGALVGIGVDAMFEQAPSPAHPAGGKRIGVRLRFAF